MKNFLPFVGLLLIALPGWTQRDCRSLDYRQQQLSGNPTLAASVEAIEQFTRLQLRKASVIVNGQGGKESAPSRITIPVVVHIIYNSPSQNISDEQVLSQLQVLNADYGKTNADTAAIPGYYASLAADCGFSFVLATVDTGGHTTTGIIRKHTNATSFTIDDDVKFGSRGGDDAWDRDRYLNLWVCNLSGSVLGYSSLVGGPRETDGVVIKYTAFGTKGTAQPPYNLGRTATHEVGHWMNLIHIWGDASCGDDEVGDTPQQQEATYGNPNGVVLSCGNMQYGNLYMDYMDFTDDIGMHLFTGGQRDRMRTLFAPGGFRHALLSSPAAAAVTGPVVVSGGNTISMTVTEVRPNPAIGMVSVVVQDRAVVGSLMEIYNQVGLRVMAVRVTDLSTPVNLSALSGGVYFIRIGGGPGFKLVKM
ncbi:MAG: T9SS type A sorting domain-containing protein [Bacteroidetes bacterium]|nr:T9SS type A sorting domain-containing protein [Bacteroidota bacterium]